jgi:tetratricopeptide (TPR) repeat protein
MTKAVWIAFLVLAAAFSYRAFDSTDTAVHILAGREMLATHRVLDSDPFSFTVRGAPWFVNQWVPEIVFAAVHDTFGIAGLVWLRVVLVCATFGILAAALSADSRVRLPAGIIVLVIALYASYRLFIVRPLLFSSLFLAILVAILESFRRGEKDRLLFVPLLFAVWVNSHAGYVFGAILFAATLGAEAIKQFAGGRLGPSLGARAIRRLALVFAGSIAASFIVASLVNPRGFRTVLLPFGLLKSDFFLNIIGEYQPADRTDLFFWILVGILLVGLVARLMARGVRGSDLTDWMTTLPFAYQAWQTHRVIFPFVIVAAPAAARGLSLLFDSIGAAIRRSRTTQRTPRASVSSATPRTSVAILAVLAAALLGLAASRAVRDPFFGAGLSPVTYPREACLRLLREGRFQGNLFHNDVWAGAVALYGWPRYPLFIDGRLEVYGEPFWRDVYFRVLGCGDGWEQILKRYDINAALLRVGAPGKRDRIGSVLREHPDWALVYWDELAMLYVRRTPKNAALIAEREVPPSVDPENLQVPRLPVNQPAFLMSMNTALAEDSLSVPALFGAVNTAISLRDRDQELRDTGFSREVDSRPDLFSGPARYLPMVRAAGATPIGRNDWRLPWLEGRILLNEDDADGARAAFERADRLSGEAFDDVAFDRVRAEIAAKRPDAAQEILAQRVERLERGPASDARAIAGFVLTGARIFAQSGDGERARAGYAEAARLDPSRADYETARAWSFVVDGRFAEAERAAGEALARFPGDPYLLGTRGWALFHLNRAAEAETALRGALARLPSNDRAARAAESAHLGEVLLARGAVGEARAFLEAAAADSLDADLPEIARARALLDSLARSSQGPSR